MDEWCLSDCPSGCRDLTFWLTFWFRNLLCNPIMPSLVVSCKLVLVFTRLVCPVVEFSLLPSGFSFLVI